MVERVIVVGCGGIGSYFVKFLLEDAIQNNQLQNLKEIKIYDNDKIESKNELYTIYDCIEREGDNKVDVLAEFAEDTLLNLDKNIPVLAIPEKVTKEILENEIANKNTVIISAVDGTFFRNLLWKLSEDWIKKGILKSRNSHWIDLRSTGNDTIICKNPENLEEHSKLEPLFADLELENNSCQLIQDLNNKVTKLGNRIIAYKGLSMLLSIDQNEEGFNKNEIYRSR